MASRYDWKCERCEDVVAGPYRPPSGHACRLCCSCSVDAAGLVFRKRGQRCAASKPKAQRPSMTWEGVDLGLEAQRLIGLEINPPRICQSPPEVRLKVFATEPTSMDGWADRRRNLIVVFAWPGATAGHLLCTLVHELAHIVTGRRHDDALRMHMLEMVREAYDVEPPMPEGVAQHYFDSAIQIALEAWCAAREA